METPQDGMISLHDALQKIDKSMTMVPMKMQEEVEQLAETKVLMMNVVRVYESELMKRDKTILDAQTYITGLEDLLAKTEVKLEFPTKPDSLKIASPKVDTPK